MTRSLSWFIIACVIGFAAVPGIAQNEQQNLPPRSDIDEGGWWIIEDLEIPPAIHLEAVSMLELDGGRVAIGTRRGEIWFVDGLLDDDLAADYHLFAQGLHEVFGLARKDGVLYATQQAEVTRIIDEDGDGSADLYETVSADWGFGSEHEFTFGSRFDPEGNIWVTLCLSGSYTSDYPFRGWCLRVNADGTTTPTCSGLRSPGGVGFNAQGIPFYTENQGPWNGACGLKELRPGGFVGHPISFPWYKLAPNMGPEPAQPTDGEDGRLHIDAARIPELIPTSVVLPYKKMGQSATAILLDESNGAFGPFKDQLFVLDYTLSVVMRVTTEQVAGVWQGACYPFREGFSTGLLGGLLSSNGQLIVGGCCRGWPTRSREPYSLQRLRWSGKTPLEILEMKAKPDGFSVSFTKPVDRTIASDPASYQMETYTHHYWRFYGSPEIDQTTPTITEARVSEDGLRVDLVIDGLQKGHVHELHLPGIQTSEGEKVLHPVAYYTLNQIPPRK
jgi:hypothetical protein